MNIKRAALVLALSTLGLGIATSASAAAPNTFKCHMTFTMSGWSVLYKTANGHGKVTCANGQSMRVHLDAKGGGPTVGKFKITDGDGEFSGVTNIDEIIGTYASASAHAGVVQSGHAVAMTKGNVSLTLTGKGTGWNVGAALSGFTIHKAK